MNPIYKIFLLLFTVSKISLLGQSDSANFVTETSNIKYRKFQLGVVSNVNGMRFTKTPDNNFTFDNRLGLGAGIHAQYNLRKNISFTLNCLYDQKKWKSYNSRGGDSKYSSNTFHTLTLPLLFKYSPLKRRLFLASGPYLGIVMKKHVKGFGEGNYLYNNAFEVGAAFGIGFSIPINNRLSFVIEARDYLNLNNSKDLGNYSKMNTTSLQLGLYYKFGKTEQIEIKTVVDTAWKNEKKRFIKFFYSPQLTYRRDIGDRTTVAGYNTGLSYLNTSYSSNEEIPKYGNEVGIMIEFVLRKRLNLNTGASFETQGFQTKSNIIAVNYGWGDIIGNWSDTTYNNYYYHSFYFISIPLTLNYVIKEKKKRKFYFGSGVEPKYLFRSSLNNDKTPFNTHFTLFYTANIGISFPSRKNRYLFIEPNFKIQNNKSIKMRGRNQQLLSAGCKIGLKF